ncbi:MAG: ABC transporter ATP-binding protein [Candidatus Omnitrophota bacterium]
MGQANSQNGIISLRNVTKFFDGKKIIKNLSLDIYRGETFVLMGCSGSGKSTILRLMTGVIRPEKGNIIIKNNDIAKMAPEQLGEIRKKFGMVFQYSALLDSLSVEDNVALPLREHTNLSESIIRIIVRMKLALVGLRGFEQHHPAKISGGMRKRVGLARAIALDPDIVFYDEPTSGLDPVIGGAIEHLIIDLSKKLNITSVVVTHNMQSIFRIADRIAMLHQGEIVHLGDLNQIKNSSNAYVRQFINGLPEGPIDFFKQNTDVFEEFSLLKRRCP